MSAGSRILASIENGVTTMDEMRIPTGSPDAAGLLARVEAEPLSSADEPLGFESRLADSNGWTLGHAIAVVREYRRFLVLTQLGTEPACPSEDVDAAWHQHITRTVDYERFCRALFGRFLHHQPSSGGAQELARHRAMYAATLARYRAAFGVAAPAAVWPDVDARFCAEPPAGAGARWAVPPSLRGGSTLALVTVVAGVLAGMALGQSGLLGPLRVIPGPLFLVLMVVLLATIGWWGSRATAHAQGVPRDALDPYEVAWLVGGQRRVAATAIAVLVDRGALALRPLPKTKRFAAPAGECVAVAGAIVPAHPVERACLAAALGGVLTFAAAGTALGPLVATMRARLVAAGLATDTASLARQRAQALVGLGAAIAVMVARVIQGTAAGRSVGLLFVLLLGSAFFVFVLASRQARATRRGRACLRALVRDVRASGAAPAPAGPRDLATWLLPMSLALFGGAAIAGDQRFAHLERAMGGNVFSTPSSSSDGGGCGSGDGCSGGGGGDGGGGGGCGGCGGD